MVHELAMSSSSQSLKRPRGTPTYSTPRRPSKRVPLRSVGSPPSSKGRLPLQELRREVSVQAEEAAESRSGGVQALATKPRTAEAWSEDEIRALVHFVCSMNPRRWPVHVGADFWIAAARSVKEGAGTPTQRSGMFS